MARTSDLVGSQVCFVSDNVAHQPTVCVYTRDFRDEDDVLRVLKGLEDLDVIQPGRSIYYKSDAFTYLDLYSATANRYGLQASLYNSNKMLAAARVAELSASQNTASQQERKLLKTLL